MGRKPTLYGRAWESWVASRLTTNNTPGVIYTNGYEAGYRAAQRDARRAQKATRKGSK